MKNQQLGITLVEVMISVLILAVGLLAANMMQMKLIAATAQSRQRSEAILLATTQFENMRDTGTCTPSTTTVTPFQGSATYTMAITCITSTNPSITITWSDSEAVTNNVTMQTNL
jgi:type IV pilus assembly protein PilV